MLEPEDLNTPENINDLARVIAAEARGVNETAQRMVGWTVVNRMKKARLTRVSSIWGQYAHGHFSTKVIEQLARDILDGSAVDISEGATHFYSPSAMPKAGEPHSGKDVGGGLETVPGVTKDNRPVQNYRPGWAQTYRPIHISGILERDFKVYKQ